MIQGFIFCQSCNICHTGIQVYGTYCVTYCFILLAYRQMSLVIKITQVVFMAFFHFFRMLFIKIIRSFSTLIDKKLAQFQIFWLFCHLIETYQCHLCNLMSRISLAFSFFRTKMSCCIICKTNCCFQQFVFSGSFIICNGSLDQMTHTIQFMMILQICENLIFSVDNIISIQISVILLSCTHDIDGSVCNCLQLRIRMLGQRITDCFDPFGKI